MNRFVLELGNLPLRASKPYPLTFLYKAGVGYYLTLCGWEGVSKKQIGRSEERKGQESKQRERRGEGKGF